MTCCYQGICIYKPTDYRIIITAGYIIEAGFRVVVVTTVAQGVGCADGSCHAAGGGEQLAPGAVLVGDYPAACVTEDANDVTLEIVLVVVGDLRAAVLVDQTVGDARFIVQEDQVIVTGFLRLQLVSQPVILGGGAANGLTCPQPGCVIGIAVGIAALGCCCQLPPVAPGEGKAIPVA